ncbi:MAG: hypothetical protein IK029_00350, partial [Oscillospiraceae bacterium]|nr:hypothetical protein [Oscillospiraceae bacterium]
MSISEYYRINRKLFAKEERSLIPYIFCGIGIVLVLFSYCCGIGLRSELLEEYSSGPLAGVILAETDGMSSINDAAVSRARSVSGVKKASGVYELDAEIVYGEKRVSASIWAVDMDILADLGLRYVSLSRDSLTAQLPLILMKDASQRLGDVSSAGTAVTMRFLGSDGIPAEIAASADTGEQETETGKTFDGKVITGLEELESVMALLYEHQVWPGQQVEITSSGHERMIYRYLIVTAEDPKDTERIRTELEESGYTCVTGFDEAKEKIAAGRPWMWGTLMSGIAFLLCAAYMIRQTKKQRLIKHRNKVLMLKDLHWK